MTSIVNEPLLPGVFGPEFGDLKPQGYPESVYQYYAQTFRATASRLDSVEFYIDPTRGPDATEFRLLVTTVVFDTNGFHPGTVIFESPLLALSLDADSLHEIVKVDTGHLALSTPFNHKMIELGVHYGDFY